MIFNYYYYRENELGKYFEKAVKLWLENNCLRLEFNSEDILSNQRARKQFPENEGRWVKESQLSVDYGVRTTRTLVC